MNRQTIIDVLAAGRVANLPSVVSNIVFGAATTSWWVHLNGLNLFWPAVAGCLLYLGGCFLNDWSDRNWDQEHKPSRAIPSGRLKAVRVLILALVCLLAGLLCAFWQSLLSGGVAVFIVLAITVYTWIHKKTLLGILPMGLCRGGLYFLGLASQTSPETILKGTTVMQLPTLVSAFPEKILPALGLASFVAGLSLLARYEAKGMVEPRKKWFAGFLLIMPGLTTGAGLLGTLLATTLFALIAFWGHHLLKQAISKGVSFLLASICLVDLIPLLLRAPSSGVFHIPNYWPFVAVSGVAFLLALLLQKVAPAT